MSDYIAEQYAKKIAEDAIKEHASGYVRESGDAIHEAVGFLAYGDCLDLTVDAHRRLTNAVSDILNTRIVIKIN